MAIVTISQREYKLLKSKAVVYDRVVRSSTKKPFPTEEYSSRKIQELIREDRLPKNAVARLTNFLKTL